MLFVFKMADLPCSDIKLLEKYSLVCEAVKTRKKEPNIKEPVMLKLAN